MKDLGTLLISRPKHGKDHHPTPLWGANWLSSLETSKERCIKWKGPKKKDPLQWVLVFFMSTSLKKLWTLQTQTILFFHLAAFSATFLHCPGSNIQNKTTRPSKALDEYVSCSRSLNDAQVDAPWPFAPMGFTEEKKRGWKTTTLGIRKSHGMMAWMIWNEKSEMSLQAICLLLCLLTLQSDIQILVMFGTIFKNSKLDLWPKELTLPS